MTRPDARGDDVDYTSQPPVFIVATSDRARAQAERTIALGGYRATNAGPIPDAPFRMQNQAAASAFWLELDDSAGSNLEPLADALRGHLDSHRCGAVVATTSALIDHIYSAFGDGDAHILIDASESERAAALALAANALDGASRLSDVASDASSVRLRQLSDEVNRIAATLARLSAEPGGPAALSAPASASEPPPVAAETVGAIIRARRLRSRFFRDDLFADPAWDMLLDLLHAEIMQLRVPVSSLCIAAAVPATTALRWLKTMVDEGLFVRRSDPHDGRRVFVELAPSASLAMRRYMAEAGAAGAV